MNFFNFFPAGQGLFYAGLLDGGNYSFVFDCGSESNRKSLSSYISELKKWNGNKQLDFVVVSHFHHDHVNGIKELYDKIGFKTLYLPYVCSDDEIRCLYIVGSYIESLYENSFEVETDIVTIIWFLNKFLKIDEKYSNDFKFYNGDWEFNFFQKTIDEKTLYNLKTKLDDYKCQNDYGSIVDAIKDGKVNDIKNVYEYVFGKNLNKYGLVLLHHPLAINDFRRTFYYPNQYAFARFLRIQPISHYFYECFYPYTLLTGDIEFDLNLSRRIITTYPTGVSGIIQIPHHGAKKNWVLFKKHFAVWHNFNIYIVPFGIRNPYGHPDSSIESDVYPIRYNAITEYSGFPYWIR